MKTYYKLTDQNNRTYNHTNWGENITHTALGKGTNFCSKDLIHFYDSPELAMIFNPIPSNFMHPNLWEVTVDGPVLSDHGIKFGAKTVTTVKQIFAPIVTTEQKVAFGILCAMRVWKEASFIEWATNWLDDINRSADDAAIAAAKAADAADRAANATAARSAARSANAADAAAKAADAADRATAAIAADRAANAAADAAAKAAIAAARADAYADEATNSAYAALDKDLKEIIKKVLTDYP